MNTTFTLLQAAVILGIPFMETKRLARAGKLKAQKRADKVLVVSSTEIQAFIEQRLVQA